jgi:hypothetical protein
VAAIVSQKRQVVGERRGANEQVEVTNHHARSAQASPFPAEELGNVGFQALWPGNVRLDGSRE